jgi:Fe-S-cluster formation regulator IscX/YfhJ
VERGRYEPPIRPVIFSLDDFRADPASTTAKILGALHGA